MGFIQRELDRLSAALQNPQSETHRAEIISARCALAWAMEPELIKAPSDAIGYISGTAAGSADCLASSHQE